MRKVSAWVATHAPTGTRWGKRTLALLLSLVLCLTLLPGAALADNGPNEGTSALTVTVEAKVQRYEKQTDGSIMLRAPFELAETEKVMVGDKIIYTITVTNNTGEEIPLNNVTITGTFNGTGELWLGDGMEQYASLTQDKTTGSYTITFDSSAIPANSSRSIELIYVVQYGDTLLDGGKLTNTASVSYSGVTYSSNEVITPVNTETFNLLVQKEWRNAPSTPEIKVMLCRNGELVKNTETKIKKLPNTDTNFTVFENLPLLDENGKQIIYSVKETVISGATLIKEGEIKDFGSGNKTCDIFRTESVNSALWYAVYDDTDATDGRVSITNRYGEKTIVVSTRINEISRNGSTIYGNSEGGNTKPVPALRAGDVIKYNITVRNYMGKGITFTVADQLIGGSSAVTIGTEEGYLGENYRIDDKNCLRENTNEKLEQGKSLVIDVITYTVQEGDGALGEDGKYYLTNRLSATYDGVTYQTEVKTEVEQREYKIYVPIAKTLKNEGKDNFESTERFEFEIYTVSDDTKKVLGKDYISVSKVTAGTSTIGYNATWDGNHNVNGVGYSFQLSKSDYEKLPKENGFRYVWISEVNNGTAKMTYDTSKHKLYLIPDESGFSPQSMPSMLTLNAEGEVLPTNDEEIQEPDTYYAIDADAYEYWKEHWNGDVSSIYSYAAEFENYYDKQERKTDTGKVGPQLNRDDHAAYIMGYPDGTVRPEGEITRAEACTIFFRLLTESSRSEYLSKANDYTDVKSGDWYNSAISTLSNAGIVTGYADGTFRPNQPITRGEMAKIIAGFAKLSNGSKTFSDLDGHWAKNYVELAAGNGWITGYPDGSFQPDKKITRAETVTMINRVLKRVPAKESSLLSRSVMLTFPDNTPGDWYYIAIQEASNSHEYQRSVSETTGDETWIKLIDNVDWTKLEK